MVIITYEVKKDYRRNELSCSVCHANTSRECDVKIRVAPCKMANKLPRQVSKSFFPLSEDNVNSLACGWYVFWYVFPMKMILPRRSWKAFFLYILRDSSFRQRGFGGMNCMVVAAMTNFASSGLRIAVAPENPFYQKRRITTLSKCFPETNDHFSGQLRQIRTLL